MKWTVERDRNGNRSLNAGTDRLVIIILLEPNLDRPISWLLDEIEAVEGQRSSIVIGGQKLEPAENARRELDKAGVRTPGPLASDEEKAAYKRKREAETEAQRSSRLAGGGQQ